MHHGCFRELRCPPPEAAELWRGARRAVQFLRVSVSVSSGDVGGMASPVPDACGARFIAASSRGVALFLRVVEPSLSSAAGGIDLRQLRFRMSSVPDIRGNARDGHGRTSLLLLGIFLNLALIGYYKYAGFFLESAGSLFGFPVSAREVFLPLGISFFTFQGQAT